MLLLFHPMTIQAWAPPPTEQRLRIVLPREALENQLDPRDNFLVIAGYGWVHGQQAARIR